MAYSPSELNREVRQIIQDCAEEGVSVSRSWLVSAILLKHPIKRNSKKDPDDFSLICRQLAVSTAIDSALAQLKRQDEGGDPDAAEFDLPRLPGFKHLRRVYPVKRSGLIMLVPIDQLTDDEFAAKVSVYRKASTAFAAHADELERYRDACEWKRPA